MPTQEAFVSHVGPRSHYSEPMERRRRRPQSTHFVVKSAFNGYSSRVLACAFPAAGNTIVGFDGCHTCLSRGLPTSHYAIWLKMACPNVQSGPPDEYRIIRMTMQTRWEIYISKGAPIGLLYRAWDESELLTDIIFGKPESHRITSRIALEDAKWRRSTYSEDGNDPIVIDAETLIEEEDAVPSYMEFLLLKGAIAHMAPDSEETLSYHVLSPADFHGVAQEASIWSPGLNLWEIETNGELASTHWTEDGDVVQSDWNGVSSILSTPEEATSALRGIVDDDVLDEYLARETAN